MGSDKGVKLWGLAIIQEEVPCQHWAEAPSSTPAAGAKDSGPSRRLMPPPCRQLSMMLMLAQSNPQLFALIGTQANLARELDRVEQQSRLEQLSPEELQSRNRGRWADWLQEYR